MSCLITRWILGAEWVEWTGLPMVFAVWAGRAEFLTEEVAAAFRASHEWGRSIWKRWSSMRRPNADFRVSWRGRISPGISCIRCRRRHLEGLAWFRKLVLALEPARCRVVGGLKSVWGMV